MSRPPPEQLRGPARPIFIKLCEMAVKVGVTPRTIKSWAYEGHISIYRISPRTLLVEEREVMDWVLSQRLKPRHVAADQPRLRSLQPS